MERGMLFENVKRKNPTFMLVKIGSIFIPRSVKLFGALCLQLLVLAGQTIAQSTTPFEEHLEKIIEGLNSNWRQDKLEKYIEQNQITEKAAAVTPQQLEKVKESKQRVNFYLAVASVFEGHSEFKSEQKILLLALRIADEAGDKSQQSAIYNMLGNIYSEYNLLDEAVKYRKLAIRLMYESGNNEKLSSLYGNLGSSFYRFGLIDPRFYDSARWYSGKALELAEAANDESTVITACQGLGLLETDLKNFKEAKKMLNRSLDLCLKTGDDASAAYIYYQLGRMYVVMEKGGENAELAIRNLETAMKYADAQHNSSLKNEVLYNFSYAYRLKGDYRKSADYAIWFAEFNDSLINSENTRSMAELNSKYESAKHESMINELNASQQKQNEQIHRQLYYIIGAGIILLIVVLFSFFLLNSNRKRKKANLELSEKNLLIEKQKHLVEEKQKEILDSIYYAQRIQRSLMTSERYIEKHLNRRNKNAPHT
jgi:tetratricopeptide (TPR) repeat protein